MLVHKQAPPTQARRIETNLIWMSDTPLDKTRGYFLKHTTRTVRASIDMLHSRTDLDTLETQSVEELKLNDIGQVTIACNQPLFCERYNDSRALGSFILIDALTNNTVAAGMIERAVSSDGSDAGRLPRTEINAEQRRERSGHSAAIVTFAGNGAADDEQAIAYGLERALFDLGCTVTVVDVPMVADGTRSAALLSDIAAQCVGLGAVVVFSRTLPRSSDRFELERRLGSEHLHTFAAASAVDAKDAILQLDSDPERAVASILKQLRSAAILAPVHE